MKAASGVDDHRLADHRFGAAPGDHHVGAVVLVGELFQRRRSGVSSGVAMRAADSVAGSLGEPLMSADGIQHDDRDLVLGLALVISLGRLEL